MNSYAGKYFARADALSDIQLISTHAVTSAEQETPDNEDGDVHRARRVGNQIILSADCYKQAHDQLFPEGSDAHANRAKDAEPVPRILRGLAGQIGRMSQRLAPKTTMDDDDNEVVGGEMLSVGTNPGKNPVIKVTTDPILYSLRVPESQENPGNEDEFSIIDAVMSTYEQEVFALVRAEMYNDNVRGKTGPSFDRFKEAEAVLLEPRPSEAMTIGAGEREYLLSYENQANSVHDLRTLGITHAIDVLQAISENPIAKNEGINKVALKRFVEFGLWVHMQKKGVSIDQLDGIAADSCKLLELIQYEDNGVVESIVESNGSIWKINPYINDIRTARYSNSADAPIDIQDTLNPLEEFVPPLNALSEEQLRKEITYTELDSSDREDTNMILSGRGSSHRMAIAALTVASSPRLTAFFEQETHQRLVRSEVYAAARDILGADKYFAAIGYRTMSGNLVSPGLRKVILTAGDVRGTSTAEDVGTTGPLFLVSKRPKKD